MQYIAHIFTINSFKEIILPVTIHLNIHLLLAPKQPKLADIDSCRSLNTAVAAVSVVLNGRFNTKLNLLKLIIKKVVRICSF